MVLEEFLAEVQQASGMDGTVSIGQAKAWLRQQGGWAAAIAIGLGNISKLRNAACHRQADQMKLGIQKLGGGSPWQASSSRMAGAGSTTSSRACGSEVEAVCFLVGECAVAKATVRDVGVIRCFGGKTLWYDMTSPEVVEEHGMISDKGDQGMGSPDCGKTYDSANRGIENAMHGKIYDKGDRGMGNCECGRTCDIANQGMDIAEHGKAHDKGDQDMGNLDGGKTYDFADQGRENAEVYTTAAPHDTADPGACTGVAPSSGAEDMVYYQVAESTPEDSSSEGGDSAEGPSLCELAVQAREVGSEACKELIADPRFAWLRRMSRKRVQRMKPHYPNEAAQAYRAFWQMR